MYWRGVLLHGVAQRCSVLSSPFSELYLVRGVYIRLPSPTFAAQPRLAAINTRDVIRCFDIVLPLLESFFIFRTCSFFAHFITRLDEISMSTQVYSGMWRLDMFTLLNPVSGGL